jgi:hypothetical protein
MALCDMGHEHPDPPPAEMVVEDKSAEVVAEEGHDEAVEVARIVADRDVQVAKIERKAVDEETVVQMAALQARVDVLEAAAAPPAPEPEILPVPVPEPGPEPEPGPPAPPEHDGPEPEKNKGSGGWWAGYR